MSLTNLRRQYAVGQGFFQAGDLSEDGVLRLRYVADCGAMSKYAEQRDARIDKFLSEAGAKTALDLLFISHAHADHLNGIERLLDKVNGLVVKTIVLPLLKVEDRLIAYARAASEDAASAEDPFYREFVVDPSTALGRFKPDRIIFVEPGDRGAGGPFSGGPDGPRNAPDDSGTRMDDRQRPAWKLVGRGTIERRSNARETKDSSIEMEVMPDTLGILCPAAGSSAAWLLAPYIDPAVKAGSAVFIAALAAARGQTVGALRKWLRSTTNLEKLLTVHIADLKHAYMAVSTDLNVTSMCLYSGPVPEFEPRATHYDAVFGTWRISHPGKPGIAWLGTGDAALADKKRRNAFLKHYSKLLDEVVTITLPHHGSESNFDVTLLDRIQPSFCIAAADRFGKWRHPGTSVVQAVASTGRFLSVVTASEQSEVVETVVAG